jgi:hypothetical protein
MTQPERKRWAKIVDEMVALARKGSPRARAWFAAGTTWRNVSTHVFTPETVQEIESQALAVYSERKVRCESAYSFKANRSAESIERRRKHQNERYAAKKAAKLAIAAQVKSFPWPASTQTGVTRNGNQATISNVS